MNYTQTIRTLLRYSLILLFSYSNLFLFYFIFTPLTIYPVGFILDSLVDNSFWFKDTTTIFVNDDYIQLIPACIAGAAYYLLVVLNLATPLSLIKRIKSLIFILSSFLILNIARILFFSFLFISGYKYFNITHLATWYIGSTLIIAIIWFLNVKLFKIEEIPFYTDIKEIIKEIKK
jgi:exosortase/archaeosortase